MLSGGAGKVIIPFIPPALPLSAQAQFTFDLLRRGTLNSNEFITNTGGCAVIICVNSLIDTAGNQALRVGVGPVALPFNFGFTIEKFRRVNPFSFLEGE